MSNTASTYTRREILNSFTTVKGFRLELNAPWTKGGYAYASNGHWMVRMPVTPEDADLQEFIKGKHPKGCEAMFDAAPWHRLQAMPPIAEPKACELCCGTGFRKKSECKSCHGIGEFTHFGIEYECQLCNGDGQAYAAAESTDTSAERCIVCRGTGYQIHGVENIIEIGNTFANAGYLKRISALAGVMFATHEDPLSTCAFRFDGGEGILMPCRPPSGIEGYLEKGGAA